VTTQAKRRLPKNSRLGVEIWHLPGRKHRVDVGQLLRRLGEKGISALLVEGGGEVHAAFLGIPRGPIWADRVEFMIAPKLLGGRKALGPIGGQGVSNPQLGLRLQAVKWRPLGQDWLIQGRPVREG
jgi:diaminohydroxyphosphoribosylaminopyrimidine deaminase/5-amino-6-(5-phosphoribosylamino)uracil reductase